MLGHGPACNSQLAKRGFFALTPSWLKVLPSSLRARVEHRPHLQKALVNTGWLFGDKLLRMGIGLLVGVWIARYLGPSQYGLMSYAIAVVALFGAVANLGLNGIVVRDLLNQPDAANEIMGSTLALQLLGGFAAFGLAVAAIALARPGDDLARLMVAVLGFVQVFKSTEVVKYWFESRVQSKYAVWVENGVFLILAGIKVVLILLGASLMAFVWASFVEGLLVALGLLAAQVWRGGLPGVWRVRATRMKSLLKDSWPLILSGLAVMVYMRIDQIMLGHVLGDEAVGVYTAAVRISEVWYFIPTAIIASVFPAIAAAKKTSESLYHQRMQQLFDIVAAISLGTAVAMTFLSGWLVTLLFGAAYADAGPVLAIHVWAGVFTFLGVASSNWFLLEGMVVLMFYRTALGALANIVLNMLLIQDYGMQGAAAATLISYSIAAFWFDALNKKTRRLFFMKANSILLKGFYVRQTNTPLDHS